MHRAVNKAGLNSVRITNCEIKIEKESSNSSMPFLLVPCLTYHLNNLLFVLPSPPALAEIHIADFLTEARNLHLL